MHFSGLTGDTHRSLADLQPGSHCSAMSRCPLHLEEPRRSSIWPARSSQPIGMGCAPWGTSRSTSSPECAILHRTGSDSYHA